jgi:hypothetical protein
MKKNLFLLVLSGLFLTVGCRKQLKEKMVDDSGTVANARIVNGHVAFKTVDDYGRFLERNDQKQFIASLPGSEHFKSYLAKRRTPSSPSGRIIGNCDVPDSLIEGSEDFFNLLDQNGILQIDTTWYRYSYCDSGVWVISDNDIATYKGEFLNGQEVPGIVGFFPDYVDVTEAIAQGYKTMPDTNTVIGNEVFAKAGLLGRTRQEFMDVTNYKDKIGTTERWDGKLAYDKYGFYFHFYGKEKYKERCIAFNWCTTDGGPRDWTVYFEYRWWRKGRSSAVTGYATISPIGNTENKCDKTFYSGNRGLRSGGALWDVNHVRAKDVFLQRNGGSSWYTVADYVLFASTYVNNFQSPQGTNHFTIAF